MNRSSYLALILVGLLVLPIGCGETNGPAKDEDEKTALQAERLLIDPGQLPQNYSRDQGNHDLGRPEFCGVVVEPRTVHDFASARYGKSAVGPFLYQYVFVGKDGENRALIAKLREGIRGCSSYTVVHEGEQITFDIAVLEQLSRYGEASIGFRVEPRPGEDKGYPAEYLAIKKGDVLVFLAAVSFFDDPALASLPHKALVAGAEAVTSDFS